LHIWHLQSLSPLHKYSLNSYETIAQYNDQEQPPIGHTLSLKN